MDMEVEGESQPRNRRVLVIDDNEGIHEDFHRILGLQEDTSEIESMEASLFGRSSGGPSAVRFHVTSAHQGEEGLRKVREAEQRGEPFAAAFVDMRMPPGWDGIETLAAIWREAPNLQAVICSAYSDYSIGDIVARLGHTDRLLILRKPFEPIEVCQMAYALTEKWNQQVALFATSRQLAARARELVARERELSALLDAIPDAILRLDGSGVCVGFKPPRGEGAPALESPVGKRLDAVLHPQAAEQLLSHVGRAAREGATQVIEYHEPAGDSQRHYEARLIGGEGGEAVVLLRDVTERSRAAVEIKERLAREELLRAQTEILASLSAPLIPISDDIVVVPLIGDLDAERVLRVQEIVVQGVVSRSARVAILDVTGVPSLGIDVGDALVRIARAVRLVGAEVLLTGVRPDVAQMLVTLEVDLGGIVTTQTLQSGITLAMDRHKRARRGSPVARGQGR